MPNTLFIHTQYFNQNSSSSSSFEATILFAFLHMKKLNLILRKCKSLSKQLGRSSSYSSLRSKSTREEGDELWGHISTGDDAVVLVGSSRRRYMISSKYLNHPLFNALIEKSSMSDDNTFAVKCEVVLFDHLLWMLDNADIDCGSLEELAELYVF